MLENFKESVDKSDEFSAPLFDISKAFGWPQSF